MTEQVKPEGKGGLLLDGEAPESHCEESLDEGGNVKPPLQRPLAASELLRRASIAAALKPSGLWLA